MIENGEVTYLEPLLHFLDEHVSVCGKAVDGKHSAVSSVCARVKVHVSEYAIERA